MIQTVQQAQAIENRLSVRRDALLAKIDDATQDAASDFEALADGAAVDTGAVVAMKAELQVLDEALEKAREGVETAQRLQSAREEIERREKLLAHLAERADLANKVSQLLDAVADHFCKLAMNGRTVVAVARDNARVKRDKNSHALSPKGYVVFDTSSLTDPNQLHHALQLHMALRVPGWRYDYLPPYGGLEFSEAMAGVASTLMEELDVVADISVSPADEKLIRAELRELAAQQLHEQGTSDQHEES